MKNGFKLSFGEEVGNAISHGVMAVLCLVLLPLVMAYMVQQKGLEIAIGVGYYMICMFMMFIVSCLYHSMHYGSSQKYVFRKLDHIMILFAIAGTYTPICLSLLDKPMGYVLLAIEWICVFIGVFYGTLHDYGMAGYIYLTYVIKNTNIFCINSFRWFVLYSGCILLRTSATSI